MRNSILLCILGAWGVSAWAGPMALPGRPSLVEAIPFRAAAGPSDDPDDYPFDTNVSYEPVLNPAVTTVPGSGLPAEVDYLVSNNNCGIEFYDGRLFLAWRTSETHFASPNAKIYIISSADNGQAWDFEWEVALGSDVREPNFLVINGQLIFTFFEAGTNPLAFEPKHFWRIIRRGPGRWTGYMPGGDPGEVPWDVKARGGVAWMTSYKGEHYTSEGYGNVDVFFRRSQDGITWEGLGSSGPVVYHGGVSEVAFEFDEEGGLWAVTRNEDGDASGFGSHLVYAPPGDLGNWQFPVQSDPERYDSAKMFRHGKDLFLLARRDIGGPFDQRLTTLSFDFQRLANLVAYSLRPKRAALCRIDRLTRRVVPVMDLPSAGDTAFLSVRRMSAHSFLLANYTSPVSHGDWSWLQGQVAPEGTSVYLLQLDFMAH